MLGRELMRWSPFEELSSWQRSHDLVDWVSRRNELLNGRWMPAVEAYKKDDNYIVRLDLPGMDTKDMDIHAEGDLLTIKGERKMEEKGPEYRETFYGSFERTVRLPQGVEADKIAARYENGVLEILVPLAKEMVGRTIPIEVADNKKTIEHKAA